MATDSSSGTFPSSSRLTIVSSSSIARPKLSFLTSTWVFSAIFVSPTRLCTDSNSMIFMRAYCGGELTAHQRAHIFRNLFFQTLQVISAFEHGDDAAARAGLGDIH